MAFCIFLLRCIVYGRVFPKVVVVKPLFGISLYYFFQVLYVGIEQDLFAVLASFVFARFHDSEMEAVLPAFLAHGEVEDDGNFHA